jgi:ATP-dependent RNA helicase SUPV3L1/SUV3
MLSITGLTLEQFARLMEGMGYRAEQGTRPKVRPAPVAEAPQAEGGALPEPAAGGIGEVSTESTAAEDSDREAGSESVAAGEVVADSVDAVSDAPEAAAETLAAEAAEGDAGGAEAPVVGSVEDSDDAGPAEDAAGQAPAAAPLAEVEMEVFYTFVRAPRQRPRQGGGQAQRGAESRGEGQERGGFRGRRGRDGKPAERSEGKPQQKSGGGKGKPQGKPAASARPPRPEKPIDPDNPFAALLALKQRG